MDEILQKPRPRRSASNTAAKGEGMEKPRPRLARLPAAELDEIMEIPRPRRLKEVPLPIVLSMLNNDRAYTLLGSGPHWWLLLFEGDLEPTRIRFEGEKPEIVPL